MSDQLTKHKEGSVRELWGLAFPMILAFISGNVMLLADRLFLARYSIEAMNASVAAGIVAVIFQQGAATITSIAEVFVGQYNGAKEYRRVASPAWQMLWFSFALFFFFSAVATWAGPYLLPQYHYTDHGLPYFQWLLYFGAATPAIATLSSFFTGIGKTRYVMAITIGGNLLNIALDPLLIFGVKGWIAPMGAKGAAIATCLSLLAQLVAFGAIFLSRSYREKYGTSLWRFEAPLFTRCLKVGVPNAVGHMIEWSAWALSLRLMASIGEDYLTVATVGMSLYSVIAFGFEGVQKAVTTLAANRLGAKKHDGIWPVWRSSIRLLALSAIPIGLLMLVFPDPLIGLFLSEGLAQLAPLLRITAAGVFLYYMVDGFTWITVGILTAAEDTWYVMWVNALTSWFCGLLPVGFLMVYLGWSPAWYFFLISLYGTCNAALFYRRLQNQYNTILSPA